MMGWMIGMIGTGAPAGVPVLTQMGNALMGPTTCCNFVRRLRPVVVTVYSVLSCMYRRKG